MQDTPVAGIVLAGGKSSRLGQDKAAICVASTGKSLLEHTVNLLQQFFHPVLVSGRMVPYTRSFIDAAPHRGPLGGIVSSMAHAQGRACCVLSCDMPCMCAEVVRHLLECRNARPAGTLVTLYVSPQGILNPLVAIYEPEALAILAACLAQGLFSLGRCIPLHRQHRVPFTEEEEFLFTNLNTLQDYEDMIHKGVLLRSPRL